MPKSKFPWVSCWKALLHSNTKSQTLCGFVFLSPSYYLDFSEVARPRTCRVTEIQGYFPAYLSWSPWRQTDHQVSPALVTRAGASPSFPSSLEGDDSWDTMASSDPTAAVTRKAADDSKHQDTAT